MDKMLVYEWFRAHGMEFLKRVSVLSVSVTVILKQRTIHAGMMYTQPAGLSKERRKQSYIPN
jgi:hypothetical protein